MKCSKCQHDNKEDAKFCRKCGSPLEFICPKCKHVNEPDSMFCEECGTKLGASKTETTVPKLEDMQRQLRDKIPQSLADRLFAGAKQMQGEYRLVTALFADVSGSSTMARNMPLEQYVDIMDECFKMMVDVISIKYEGSINRFIGDCVLAFFGAPITHENDAERAILAALDIQEGIKELDLSVSIGINTGMTYFGEMGNNLIYQEHSAWGPDVDFAKRLQESAQPEQILIGLSTYRLTRRAFDYDKIVDIDVKGSDRQQTAYPVIRISQHPEKLRGIEGLRARMIGREREFSDLKEAADSLIAGRGSIVSIIGEAGLGKSRLSYELRTYLEDKDVQFYEGRCLSLGQTVSYWPFLDILRTYLNLSDSDTEVQVSMKLRETMTELFPNRHDDIIPFIANLLSVNLSDELDDKLKYFTPEQIRHQTIMRLRDVFTEISRQKPLMLILEDLHWADDLSLDLISLFMDELTANPLMFLCIYRPEKEHRCWQLSDLASRKCLDRYTEITLRGLTSSQSRELVESLLEIDNLPESTKTMILRKSEGNPFFIEEVIRYLIDRGIVYREGDRWKATSEIDQIDVPDTIQSVVLSRVDKLESETKYVLQCASVIGRLFRYRLLDHISQHERNLEGHLSKLEDKQLILEERTVPEMEYSFKHAFTQESTYQGILERRRRSFHSRVADGIENLYKERIDDFYEELAYHHKLAGNEDKAIEYLLKAGIKLAGRYSNHEALIYYDQVAELLSKSDKEYRKEKALLHEKRGESLQWIGQWLKALSDYKEALKWSDAPYDRAEIYRKIGRLESSELRDRTNAIRHLELGLGELPEDDRSLVQVRLELVLVMTVGHWSARTISYDEIYLRCKQSLKIAEEMGYRSELAMLYALLEHYNSWWYEEYSDEYGEKAIEIAEELGDLPTLAHIYSIMGDTRSYRRKGDYWTQQGIEYYHRALEISRNIGDVQTQAICLGALGNIYKRLGQKGNAIESLGKALKIATTTRSVEPLLSSAGVMEIYGEDSQTDMLIGTFSQIMRALDSLEVDEESLAWALFIGFPDIYSVYLALRNAYNIMGKEDSFSDFAKAILEDLLDNANTRPLKAWYHIELMNLYLESGDTDKAKSHASEIVYITDEMNRPVSMTIFYPAYLLLGDISASNDMVSQYMFLSIPNHPSEVDCVYQRFGKAEAFRDLCRRIEQDKSEHLKELGINQLCLKDVKCPEAFRVLEFEDKFNWAGTEMPSPWTWVEIEGMSSYTINQQSGTIEISAGKGSQPMLTQALCGNFVVETRIGAERLGGIVIDNGENIITFEHWQLYYCPFIVLTNKHDHVFAIKGRGFLESESLILRLERSEDLFQAYCSADGINWYSCGWLECQMDDPVQVGIFASCAGNKDWSVTGFEYFKVYRSK